MMAGIIEHATYRLTGVIELREWDEAAECYMPINPDSRIPCAHCGKLCQKLYAVTRDQDGQEFLIGPGCCRKNLFGWEPEKEAVKRFEKENKKLVQNKAHQKLVALVLPIVAEVAALSIPEIVHIETRQYPSGDIPVYGMVDSQTHVYCREGLTEERRNCCIEHWKREQVQKRLEALLPRTAILNSEDTNFKKRYKLEYIAYKELGI